MKFNRSIYDLKNEAGEDLRTEMRVWNRDASENGRYDAGDVCTLT